MSERRTKQDVDNDESYSLARKHYFRAEKTTANNDDFKVLIMGVVAAVIIMIGSIFVPLVQETRTYRDVVGITPFHGVRVYGSELNAEKTAITIYGELIKRRCTFEELIAYVVDESGLRHIAVLDTTPENAGEVNRPPSKVAESWGPWEISVGGEDGEIVPVAWQIFAAHTQCDSPPYNQINLFADGPWVTHK